MNGFRKVLHSKIHRATVTHADVHYEGSISIPPELLAAANMGEYEAVWLWNVTSGTRLETYTILGRPGSGEICVNGAAAHLMKPGEIIIIAAFTWVDEEKFKVHRPTLVFLDEKNAIKRIGPEVAGPSVRKA